MLYYTIYIKNLQNGTGYIDVALEDEQLLRDYAQFLDIGMKPHKPYMLTNPAGTGGTPGKFALNIADVVAITVSSPK